MPSVRTPASTPTAVVDPPGGEHVVSTAPPVDPTTWLPIRTREETETGGPDKAITEVSFLQFDQPATVEPPVS